MLLLLLLTIFVDVALNSGKKLLFDFGASELKVFPHLPPRCTRSWSPQKYATDISEQSEWVWVGLRVNVSVSVSVSVTVSTSVCGVRGLWECDCHCDCDWWLLALNWRSRLFTQSGLENFYGFDKPQINFPHSGSGTGLKGWPGLGRGCHSQLQPPQPQHAKSEARQGRAHCLPKDTVLGPFPRSLMRGCHSKRGF